MKKANPPTTSVDARERLADFADAERAIHHKRFFKTGPGEYGEGDQFIGVRVPDIRRVSRECSSLPLAEVVQLLRSEIHEERLLALLLLVNSYDRGNDGVRREVFDSYLANRAWINNWDLVDSSAPNIFGRHVSGRGEKERIALARSEHLWDRRIAIVSTLYSTRQGETAVVRQIAEMLLEDRHDLIQKAVGWMLREAGKRDPAMLRTFLEKHAGVMPRTMLRYAIERLPESERRSFMVQRAQMSGTV